MKFYCVTPCLNAEAYIEETMLSVINQTVFESSNFSLRYIVVDGGSVDGTVKVIERVISRHSNKKNLLISFISDKDDGLYDALAKGFGIEKTNSDVYSYMNAGDFYSKYAFAIVADIFANNKVHFLTGMNALYNEKSHLINLNLPFSYSKRLLLKGFYGKMLPFIQQESTFWSQKLHGEIDFEKLKKLKLAGDYYLWRTFIQTENLYIVSAWLGGFKIHNGQLSSKYAYEYAKEQEMISIKPTFLDYIFAYFYKIMWWLPDFIKRQAGRGIFEFDHSSQKYCLKRDFT